MTTAPSRPAVRYHGGKWRLAPWVIAQMPPHRSYVEPFGGAASVLLQKPRAYAEIYNDLDGQIVNLFRVLRDPFAAAELRRLLLLTPYSRRELELAYEDTCDTVEQARRSVVKAQMSFSSDGMHAHQMKGMPARYSPSRGSRSGFRSDSSRSGTTPAHDWASYPDVIPAITARLSGVVIEQRPAIEVIEAHDRPDTLHFVDPPYVHGERTQKSGYGAEMSDDDHRELAASLRTCRGMVMVCGYPSALYDALYDGWHRVSRTAQASGQNGNSERTECLWLNPAAVAAAPSLFSAPVHA